VYKIAKRAREEREFPEETPPPPHWWEDAQERSDKASMARSRGGSTNGTRARNTPVS
jgi:hypothetical protein